MNKLEIKNISSLEKVMPQMQCNAASINNGSALINEEFSYQVVFKLRNTICGCKELKLEVFSDIAECITIYNVRNVPVMTNRYWTEPYDDYISNEPGLFPDALEPDIVCTTASSYMYKSVWVSVKTNSDIEPGVHNINILFKAEEEIWGESSFELEVIGEELPKTDIPYTNWLHCDCISSYHGCEPLSERHWELIDKYMQTASEHGINMILTPVFTPALDTKVGAERPTVQLVDIDCKDGEYTFGFEKLFRWFELCRKNGIEYIEITHLYSQWGAEHTPKIEVVEDGRKIKKFGWHTDALSDNYKDFLKQFIPELKKVLRENWDKEKVYFHISDEPNDTHIEHYGNLYAFIKPLLGDFKLMDAMSDYELYEKGFIEVPVAATTSINDFLNKDIENLWVYYCCGQGKEYLSNRFIAMPSYRNRIMGVQLYKYNIKGFLQWGYNFYYSQLSTHLINPYLVTDAEGAFPAGDAFSVYPAQNGANPSIRLKVFRQGLQDMMAFKLLESKIGRKAVMNIIEENELIDFNCYPRNADYILTVREKVNAALKSMLIRKDKQ